VIAIDFVKAPRIAPLGPRINWCPSEVLLISYAIPTVDTENPPMLWRAPGRASVWLCMRCALGLFSYSYVLVSRLHNER
jgi:hypothetical protein